MLNHLFIHCRGGFESECAAEITDRAAAFGIFGYVKSKAHTAHVIFVTQAPDGAQTLIEQMPFESLIFARQWFAAPAPLVQLAPDDRLTPILDCVKTLPFAASWQLETVDTNEGKGLNSLTKKLAQPLTRLLEKRNLLRRKSPWSLHLLFTATDEAWVGLSPLDNHSPWLMGIPRLKLPKESPSRATLKLEEAWHQFIPRDQWDLRLAASMTAVDLGAAPGGWTWLLVSRGMFVQAVDNGPMQQALMDSGQVVHQREDGFVFEPRKPVDWLVCDIVDKPARTLAMVLHWFVQGHCRQAIFNLKLPMKQRYQEVQKLLARLTDESAAAGVPLQVRARQLYHDREEITVYAQVTD
ncbi:23S rRNA (cytidine(2498)-2'-O)-methyltransferase RlmM [Simiduia agarivorans]|uniref:Ribosomal RNA large subunit methyltransferase M n=1 Tax=Simiduia agarivorans (strain DSM 21679 / JCM 13881 / BCRC 17597 / SA1) TaxID=1117647 RepID=K4KVS5_SIMAS|nr:23S rRNA (cytidine(2498)-2'-O)-methyltransferase RlmM [Simiduia agarivorans]AFU98042.1 23S rRNA C2498 ribose 2'-O-ribose methyltransferase [Simiduia agarivorans SA1 = DSM 21679]